MKLVSWNVNGLRSILKKNFVEFLKREKPDILCLQEIKCEAKDVDRRSCDPGSDESVWPPAYQAYYNSAVRKGFSGTAILSKRVPLKIVPHMGVSEHDKEGRVLLAEFNEFNLVNVYVPNSRRDLSRLSYRQCWDRDFLAYVKRLERKKPVVFCGDLNVAHTAIDLANPKSNARNHGFTIEERAGFEAFVKAGFLDSFREFEKGTGHYTWWSTMNDARSRNIGWRIDYFLISATLRPYLRRAFIRNQVFGSDHCPVGIELDAN